MNTSLKEYRNKRRFDVTSEPAGAEQSQLSDDQALTYVIQRHEARRLHYDFRLELNGVLVSWAVPKGPSMDPSVKRLAVHVEDHPIEYGGFEGDIPAGQYGAGHVDIWDAGQWEPKGDPVKALAKGHLHFWLRGGRLGGAWVLLRTSKEDNQWLLRKLEDEFAIAGYDAENEPIKPIKEKPKAKKKASSSPRKGSSSTEADSATQLPADTPYDENLLKRKGKARLPQRLSPQLATLVSRPPAGGDWSYEVKYDGYRILCRLENDNVVLLSRSDNDWTTRMSKLAHGISQLKLGDGWLDGEVVSFDKQGVSNFQALQQALDGKAEHLVFVAFDLLFWNGHDLRRRPLAERQALLEAVLADVPADASIMLTQRLPVADATEGSAAWTEACRLSLEGLLCKKLDAPYTAGRNMNWLKLKCRPRQEFVVGGYTAGSGSRSHFGSLLLGLWDGEQLRYTGRVGTGFSAATLKSIHEQLKTRHIDESPFESLPTGKGRFSRGRRSEVIQWVQPELVVDVEYAGWTEEKLLRQASFRGLREDKPSSDVVPESASEPPPSRGKKNAKSKTKAKRKDTEGGSIVEPSHVASKNEGRLVGSTRVSHPKRIVFRDPDITKREVVEYYEAVADLMFPHLEGRHIALLRCPDGTQSTCFFQKHLPGSLPQGVSRDDGDIIITDPLGAAALAQRGVIEFHTWGSRMPKTERPDRITLDLDPDPNVSWETIVEAALLARTLMQETGLTPFLKTTGGKGLHLVAPLRATHDWDTVKAFARGLASHLASLMPDRFTATVSKARRKDRIFVDYLRNGNGATAVSAFSLRARQGAPVSVPLSWDDLSPDHDLRSDFFNLRNVLRFYTSRPDPWEGYAGQRKTLKKPMIDAFKD